MHKIFDTCTPEGFGTLSGYIFAEKAPLLFTFHKRTFYALAFATLLLFGCTSPNPESSTDTATTQPEESPSDTLTAHLKPFHKGLPTIGLLMYNGVLTTEVTATADVFTKPTEDGKQLFNVITIAETSKPIVTEEGLKIIPDYTFENCPKLTVLFVPSAYDMYSQVHNHKIVDFIKAKDKETEYTVSNCAGAQLIGASGIEDGRKIDHKEKNVREQRVFDQQRKLSARRFQLDKCAFEKYTNPKTGCRKSQYPAVFLADFEYRTPRFIDPPFWNRPMVLAKAQIHG